jgi:hypothetical protein
MVRDDDTSGAPTPAWKVCVGGGLTLLFHGAMVISIALLSLLVVFDTRTLLECTHLAWSGSWQPNLLSIGLHFGLAALFWGGCVGIVRYWRRRRQQHQRRALHPKRGSVMVETLIVLLPFLLLTSGLGQLAINNISTVLAEYAAFQGARTAWLWEPELDANRVTVSRQEVRRRARLTAATAMAPSAPSDFRISASGTIPTMLENHRASMMASFAPGRVVNGQDVKSRAANALGLNRSTGSPTHTFAKAFDTESLEERAPRKLTYAYLAFEQFRLIDSSDEVGIEFHYNMQQVFPWFSYIHGERKTNVGGRDGFFVTLRRRATLTPQVRH